MTPDLDLARSFVKAFTGNLDAPMRIRCIHDRDKKRRVEEAERPIKELSPAIVEWQRRGYGMFYVLNAALDPGKDRVVSDYHVTKIRALAADSDEGLPPVEKWHQPPSLIVRTSRVGGTIQKGQLIWRVLNCPVTKFEDAQKRLASYYGSDPSICNPSRVLRLPGTLHLKDPTNPQLVTFEIVEGNRAYTLGELMQGVPKLGAKPRQSASAPTGEPVTIELVRDMLSYIDSGCPRVEWLPTVGAIRNAPVPDDDDGSKRRALAHEWSERGRNYTCPEDVDAAFDSGDIPFGTLVLRAREGGYTGPSNSVTTKERFKGYLGSPDTRLPDYTPSSELVERMKQRIAEDARYCEEVAKRWSLR